VQEDEMPSLKPLLPPRAWKALGAVVVAGAASRAVPNPQLHAQQQASEPKVFLVQDRVAHPPIGHPPIIHPPIWRPRPAPSLGQELRLLEQSARVSVNEGVARTRVEQVFENPTGRTVEGTYLYPLPEGAAVSNFAMTVNGKRVEAEILDGDKAREIYTGIVQKMRDPAILEFVDRNLVRARIFPVAAGDKPRVELEYSEALRPEGGGDGQSFRYVLPLRLPVGGSASKNRVEITLSSPRGLRAVYSPTHAVDIQRQGDRATISQELNERPARPSGPGASTSAPESRDGRDFVLYFTTGKARVGVSAVTYRPPGEDPYFMLLVAPDAKLAEKEIAAKDVVFVCDTSGSMSGEKIEQARRALESLLGNLNPADRFGVITFSSDVRRFRDALAPASKDNLDAARSWVREIKAVGGTNINDALLDAFQVLGPRREGTRARQVVFLTDGQPTVGETSVPQILKNVREKNPAGDDVVARLFSFGVGFDVNTRLLDTLAEDNRGSSDYVLPEEDIEAKVGSLYSKLAFPVLSSPRLEWSGAKVYDVYPRRLPDLFRGTQTIIFGRVEGAGTTARAQLLGSAGAGEARVGEAASLPAPGAERHELLPRLWATRKIGYLIDDARRNSRPVDGEVRDEIIKLSKKYGVVTPFTAALITEDTPGFPGTAPNFAIGGGFGGGGFGGAPAGGLASRDLSVGGRGRNSALEGRAAAPALSAPDAGAQAVTSSQARRALKESERVDETQGARYVEGKAFFLREGVWFDGSFDETKSPKPQVVKFGSPEYFALLRDKSVAKWLSVGDKVVLVLPNRVVRVE
jgi:Ca-activated chloride channel family protein